MADLPISEIPVPKAAGKNAADPHDQMTIFFSRNGGWAAFVGNIGHDVAKAGLPMVVISSTSVFATEQSPDSISRAIETVFVHNTVLWDKSRFMLAGFSFGADVLPIAAEFLDD